MLSTHVRKHFDSAVIKRGASYFRGGHVVGIRRDKDGAIRAHVQGQDLYSVQLLVTPGPRQWSVSASCTCPYIDEQGAPCKHIWAALLSAESRRGILPGGQPPARVRLSYEPDWDLDDDDARVDDDEDFEDEPSWPALSVSPLSRPPEQGAALREWVKEMLHATMPQRASSKTGKKREAGWKTFLHRLEGERPIHGSPVLPRPQAPLEPTYILEPSGGDRMKSFALSLAHRQVRANGTPGKLKKLTIGAVDVLRMPDPIDRTICLMLVGAAAPGTYGYRYGYSSSGVSGSSWSIPHNLHREIVPLLFQTGRFLYKSTYDADPMALAPDEGGPWELVLAVQPDKQPKTYRLAGRLRRGDQLRDIRADCIIQGNPCLLVENGRLIEVHPHDCSDWLPALCDVQESSLRAAELPKLMEELAKLSAIPPVHWPVESGFNEICDVAPSPELRLTHEKGSYRPNFATCEVLFNYGKQSVPAGKAGSVLVDPDQRAIVRRQSDVEEQLLSRLQELGVERETYSNTRFVSKKRVEALVAVLLAEGWRVLGDRKPYRSAGNLSTRVSSGIDWFDLEGEASFDGQTVALADLWEAHRRGNRFVQLGDGSFGLLPDQWLHQHEACLGMARAVDGHMRFARSQVGVIDVMLADMPETTFDDVVATARGKLQAFTGILSRTEPADFHGALRPYQRDGLGWLHFLNDMSWGGCLADDMGLGKTVQVLALLAQGAAQSDGLPSLVVAPKSLIFNWTREAERFAPGLRPIDYTGTDRAGRLNGPTGRDIVLTTYGTLRRDIETLGSMPFNYVILDEAQAIKNAGAQCARAVRLLNARNRLALTGTPIENHLGELWSLFEFLNPGLLGTRESFTASFVDRKGRDDAPERRAMLARMLRPFILRRTKAQVAPELPSRNEQTVECEMGTRQSSFYRRVRDTYRASLLSRVDRDGLSRSKMHVLEALLRLRQAACHPGLADDSERNQDSAKIDALLPMLEDIIEEGHKALVFSQFTSFLALLRPQLDKRGWVYEYLDGKTQNRAARVDRFQADPKCPLFLISLKAGGVGLNLTAAEYVFILDPWWNPAVEAQAIDRTHRIGQTRKVIAYRLIARDTVESRILELQATKRDLSDAIIGEKNSVIRTLTREDLALLLS